VVVDVVVDYEMNVAVVGVLVAIIKEAYKYSLSRRIIVFSNSN
jgi:hypothetical protein